MNSDSPSVQTSEAVALVKQLVRAESVNPPGDTSAVIRVLAERLDRGGIPWRVLEPKPGIQSLVANLSGSRPGRALLLNGHVDVVPAGEGWSVDPYAGVDRDGRIYGRGTSDMKGGIAAMLLAVLELKRLGADLAGEILFTAAADEETGGTFGTGHLIESGVGANAAFAIVGEPTDLRIDLGNRGVAWLEIRVKGKAGHPGRPATGVNAVHYAGRLIAALASMRFDLRNDLFEVPTPSITATMVQGGVKANIIPDICTITLDRRMLPGETGELALRQVQGVVDSLPEPGIAVEVHCNSAWDPYQIAPEEPIVQALSSAHASVVGAPPALGAKGGATDASHIYHRAGIPTAIYGPGTAATAHTVDEYVDIRQVVTAAQVYALTARRLLGNEG